VTRAGELAFSASCKRSVPGAARCSMLSCKFWPLRRKYRLESPQAEVLKEALEVGRGSRSCLWSITRSLPDHADQANKLEKASSDAVA
jgi:hypothetical protein